MDFAPAFWTFFRRILVLVRKGGKSKDKYTTYVKFDPLTYSIEQQEVNYKKKLEIADELISSGYVKRVIDSVRDIKDIYIPGGNRQLFEAAAVFFAIVNRAFNIDYTAGQKPYNEIWNKYCIHTKDGGEYIAHVNINAQPSDPDYKRTVNMSALWSCGDMRRWSDIYTAGSWSIDTPLCSRVGTWKNNLVEDYDYLYEYITGAISDAPSNSSKFARLRERKFIDDNSKVNIMVASPEVNKLLENLPSLPQDQARRYIDAELEAQQLEARNYPEQMRDLILNGNISPNNLAVIVLNKLYESGTFKPLTENEKVTSQLIMFSDKLPE